MCGIAGIWHLNNSPLSETKLKRFTDSIAHRGPDGSGYKLFKEDQLGLGHRRLSILDLSEAGSQPMSAANERYWITYNGEIYNFIELRKELKLKGYNFKTESDTEVLLNAYLCWGKDCLNYFNGMWAFAIWDKEQKTLFLARDRFGVKPLYYHYNSSNLFAFASETYAFKFLDNFRLEYNEERISAGIDNPVNIEGEGYTIWEGILQLLPGHYIQLSWADKTIQQKRWFEISKKPVKISYDEAVEDFFELVSNAIKLRLRSDVPVATALSGGLDSSTVYAMLYHLKQQNLSAERVDYKHIKGFVATFKNTLQDETEYAKSVVDFCNGDAEFLETDFTSIIAGIESSTRLFNDITGTPISVLGDVYKSMRKHNYLVSLDGHGVDEMLYGYRSLVGMAITQSIMDLDATYENDLSDTYISMFHEAFQQDEKQKLKNKSENFKQLLSVNNPIGKIKYNVKRRVKASILSKPEFFTNETTVTNPHINLKNVSQLSNLSDRPVDLSYYNLAEKELAIDFYYRNIPYNMRDFDRAAMQHGVEIRMPFMDFNLVNFVFNLHTQYKVGKGYTKRILRDAMKNILPEKVSKRKLKIGMGAPIHDWFNQQLNQYLLDTVHSNQFTQNNLWNGKRLKEMVSEKCMNKSWQPSEAQQFWNILNAHIILT